MPAKPRTVPRSMTLMNRKRKTRIPARRLLVQTLEGRRLLAAGPYAPAAGQPGSTAISTTDPALVGWATAVVDYTPGSNVDEIWKETSNALGRADGNYDSVVSLGRGGSITLTFDAPIRDGLGADFAVYENSINDTFLELGFVEVSSDGVHYFRFDADSKTPAAVASFGELDPTNVHNLAGKYRGGFGTPFDLAELRDQPGLDVTSVKYVRLVDIVGDGQTGDATGDPIYDPTPTFQSAGLDVDGVGVIHAVESREGVVDFEELGGGLGGATFDSGATAGGEFSEDEISLHNDYSSLYQSWSGWSISQVTDNTTEGYTNQFSNITGSGVDDSATYAVGFVDTSPNDPLPPPTITVDPTSGSRFDSLYVTNATYATLSMRNGDGFAKKFGGVSGNDADFLQLTVTGVDAAGNPIGDVTVMLADYRFADNSKDFILDAWTRVDVSSLADATSLQFTLESSDNSSYGMNTPAYFAVDNVSLLRPAVPLDFASPITSEDASVLARVSRPTDDSSTAMVVSLARTGSDQASLPSSVTIPAGAAFAEFNITPVNDATPSPDRQLQVTASSDPLSPTTRSLLIQDDDTLSLNFTPSVVQVTEGDGPGGATLTLTRNDGDLSTPLTVTLIHDTTDLLAIPATVTFSATQRHITIPIDVLDDDLASNGLTIGVQADAPGYESSQLTIELTDDDLAALRIDPTSVQLSEADPSTLQTVKIFRNTEDISNALRISLALPEGAPLTVPSEVTIPADTDFVSFDVGVIDDLLVNSMATYWVSAISAGFLSGSLEVDVIDNDGSPPGLQITAPENGLSESDAVANCNFESLGAGLLSGEFNNNAGVAGEFTDGALRFENSFDNSFGFDVWSGFAISRGTDSETAGFGNQYSSVAGGGAEGSSTYAVAYAGSPVAISRDSGSADFSTIDVTNTTYAALSMRDGDDFSKKFGGETGDEPDFLLLTIDGIDAEGNSIGEVEIFLADYRFDDSDADYILDDWSTIDVSSIGAAETLSMRLTSSDNGEFGMNTPAYFAVDNVLLEPESSSLPMITLARTGGDITAPLEVSLSDDRGKLRLPSQVTIAAGESQVSVPVVWLNDAVAEGDRDWQVIASATGFTDATQKLTLHDDDENQLSITPSTESIAESTGQQTIGFEDIGKTLAEDSFNQGTDGRGGFYSGSLSFPAAYDSTYGSWSGWAASNMTDVATAGYSNQFSAYADLGGDRLGGGADGSTTFAVAGGYGSSPLTITLPEGFDGAAFESIDVTNTTYTALSMLDGDDFAKKFGGESGNDPDYFLLTIDGIDDAGETLDSIEFYLADYRFDDNSLDYVVDDWTTVDLSSLAGATSLQFVMSSSDSGDFGMNTPAFFAIDDLTFDRSTGAGAALVIARNSGDLTEDLVVTLDAVPTQPLSVPLSVVIPAGVDRMRVPLDLVDDALYTGDQTIEIAASATGFTSVSTSIAVIEDERPSLVLADADDNIELDEGGPTKSFTVQLPSAPTGPVTISVVGGEDSLDIAPTELSFSPADWDQPQTITMAGRLDLLAENEQVIHFRLANASGDYAPGDVWVQLSDYQPKRLTLERIDDAVELVDDERDYIFGQYADDDTIAIALSDKSQQLTFESLGREGATVNLGGGDDTLGLHSAVFDAINGGAGQDSVTIAPADLSADESVDVGDWLTQRVVGFEDVILGSATLGDATASIPFTLDAESMQSVFASGTPNIVTAIDQAWSLVGDWRIGEPEMEDGTFVGRMVSGDAEVWVTTDRPYQNFVQHCDVDASGDVTSLDALMIINRINADPEHLLSPPTTAEDFSGIYYDVSGDGFVTSLDALQVINWVNARDTPGDPVAVEEPDAVTGPVSQDSAGRSRSTDTTDRSDRNDPSMIDGIQRATEASSNYFLPNSIAVSAVASPPAVTMGPIEPAAVDLAITDLTLLSKPS